MPTTREPPNLDAIAEGDQIVAIETKLLEYITSTKQARFAAAYDGAVRELANDTWASAYERLKASPNEFRCVDAAQIVKHYLGLKSVFPKRPVTLLYLYWEPVDKDEHRLFAQHRAEIDSFSEHLADADVGFASLTYTELWCAWAEQTHPNWLPRHVELLTKRYLPSNGIRIT